MPACMASPRSSSRRPKPRLSGGPASGGPPVPSPPTRRGFGLRLLERGLAMQAGMRADLRFESEGLRCTLRLPPPRPAATGAAR